MKLSKLLDIAPLNSYGMTDHRHAWHRKVITIENKTE